MPLPIYACVLRTIDTYIQAVQVNPRCIALSREILVFKLEISWGKKLKRIVAISFFKRHNLFYRIDTWIVSTFVFNKGSSIHDVMEFWTFLDPLPPSSFYYWGPSTVVTKSLTPSPLELCRQLCTTPNVA